MRLLVLLLLLGCEGPQGPAGPAGPPGPKGDPGHVDVDVKGISPWWACMHQCVEQTGPNCYKHKTSEECHRVADTCTFLCLERLDPS